MHTRVAATLAAAVITGTLFGLVALREVWRADGNYSVLLRISPRYFNNNPMMRQRPAVRESLVFDPGGYDAQFNYFAAFDPLMRRYAHAPDNYSFMMDAAPYRFGRIGHAWFTQLLSGGRWRAFPAAMVWSVLLGCMVAAIAVSRLAVDAGRSPWWGVAVAVVPGFWQSIQVTLPEPIAAAAVLVGYWCWTRDRWAGAIIAFAVALLTRETSAIAVAGLGAISFATGQRWRAAALVALSALPLLIWKWHIGQVLFSIWGWESYFYDPGTFDLPFAGMSSAWREIMAGTYYPGNGTMARAAVGMSLLVLLATALSASAVWTRFSAPALIAAIYGVMTVSLAARTVWTHPGNVQRTGMEVFLWLMVVAATWPAPGPAVRRITIAGVCAGAVFILLLAHDAAKIRAAFLPWS